MSQTEVVPEPMATATNLSWGIWQVKLDSARGGGGLDCEIARSRTDNWLFYSWFYSWIVGAASGHTPEPIGKGSRTNPVRGAVKSFFGSLLEALGRSQPLGSPTTEGS